MTGKPAALLAFLAFALLAACATLGVFLATRDADESAGLGDKALKVDLWVAESAEPKTSLELKSRDSSYRPLSSPSFIGDKAYVYIWLVLGNESDQDRELRILNRSANSHTELLVPDRYGAATVYRQGDAVSLSERPIYHNRAAFPVLVPSGMSREFVVEYHGERGVAVDLAILSPAEFFARNAAERMTIGLIVGSIAALAITFLAGGLVLGRKELLAAVAFILAAAFSAFRQSRILLLLFPAMTYKNWLLPLSIALVMAGTLPFALSLLGKDFPAWPRRILLALAALALALATAAFWLDTDKIADLLYMLSLLDLALLMWGALRGATRGKRDIPWVLLALLPWIASAIADILVAVQGSRLTCFEEYRQSIGLAVSLVLLAFAFLVVEKRRMAGMVASLETELGTMRRTMDEHFASIADLRAKVYRQVGHHLRFPLDGIVATVRILEKECAEPKIAAASALIVGEAESLRRKIDDDIQGWIAEAAGEGLCSGGGADNSWGSAAGELQAPALASVRRGSQGRICLFDRQPAQAARKALILESEGFEVMVASERRAIAECFARDEADVLVLDPYSVGDETFMLCDELREERNMLELPILMITNIDADYQRRRGYASGVNDFLTRPFSTSELVSRIQSLARLKQVARHNHDLARSEKEKNAFLYFLTHNVNTPLTILLNRIRELETETGRPLSAECLDDLRAASQEISDIVRNVLISFRLADGRQTIRLEEFDLCLALAAVERDLKAKAEAKGQSLSFSAPLFPVEVNGDCGTIRGILYNIVDNAIKFSPKGGRVRVELVPAGPVGVFVRDSGPGIRASERGRLFRRFESLSTKPTGGESSTGLGLYVAAELARMNGANLEYLDEGGGGACFALVFAAYGSQEASYA